VRDLKHHDSAQLRKCLLGRGAHAGTSPRIPFMVRRWNLPHVGVTSTVSRLYPYTLEAEVTDQEEL